MVTVISTMFVLNEEGHFVENLSIAAISDILYIFGLENFIFIRVKSRDFEK